MHNAQRYLGGCSSKDSSAATPGHTQEAHAHADAAETADQSIAISSPAMSDISNNTLTKKYSLCFLTVLTSKSKSHVGASDRA